MSGNTLEQLYKEYNRREFVEPDPLQFLYNYNDKADREIVGLVASSLAYGRVAQILKSVQKILDILGEHPHDYLTTARPATIRKAVGDFKHRFTTADNMTSLLTNIRGALKDYGSLNECFVSSVTRRDEDVVNGLKGFAKELACGDAHLIPNPERGGACKRLNLYLRWMVRKDDVDPGGWHGVSKKQLIIPLDVHMARIGQELGMTDRKTPDMKMALSITSFFSEIVPGDPVKYDFSLTRFGIRNDLDFKDLCNKFDNSRL